MPSAARTRARAAAAAGAADPPAAPRAVPTLVPLLRPLTEREVAFHEMRNRLTYIAGTARTLRRRLENGRVDRKVIESRLEKIERAAWDIEETLRGLED